MPIVFTRYKASDPRVLLSSSRGLELTPPRGFLVQLSRSVDLSGFSGRGVAGATPIGRYALTWQNRKTANTTANDFCPKKRRRYAHG